MIDLNKDHREFCMKHEVMCLIPKLPARADIQSIGTDLGVNRNRVQQLIQQIGEQHGVSLMPGRDDIAVGCSRYSWKELDHAASSYYQRVYDVDAPLMLRPRRRKGSVVTQCGDAEGGLGGVR